MTAPLADRLRPQTFEEFIGQSHLVGEKGAITSQISSGHLNSFILWGPPGTGKTTLAFLVVNELKRPFYTLSAINAGVKDVRSVIEKAGQHQGLFKGKSPVLFIDEIHRFSKSQQDSLLAAVEKGIVTLIGATTENPSFEVISALLSRCQVYVLNPLDKADLEKILHRAMQNDEQIKSKEIDLKETEALLLLSGGDARKLLNIFELVVFSLKEDEKVITNELVSKLVQQNPLMYDKSGEQHYDVISAFIKSIRGSDPNAAVYWLARMIESGEDLKFIARRLLILASEDIGNANPNALLMANSTFQAVSVIGYPESRIILSQCVVYLATSPKSNSTYVAINKAQKLVNETGALPVPLHLRNAPTKLMKELGYGEDYLYAHAFKHHFAEQEFLPELISGTVFYDPADNSKEKITRDLLKQLWKDRYSY